MIGVSLVFFILALFYVFSVTFYLQQPSTMKTSFEEKTELVNSTLREMTSPIWSKSSPASSGSTRIWT